jgi:hypothetical protein
MELALKYKQMGRMQLMVAQTPYRTTHQQRLFSSFKKSPLINKHIQPSVEKSKIL